MLELISVHVTKCAGISFRTALQSSYTPEGVLLCYDDNPANPISPTSLDPVGALERARVTHGALPDQIRVLHGHFHVDRFAFIDAAVPRITILRHPVDRVISHYFFFRPPVEAPIRNPIRSYMLEHDLSLLQFCRLPRIRHFYRHVYFAGVDRSHFALVGSVERLDHTMDALSAMTGRRFVMPVENVGRVRTESPPVDTQIRAALATLLADDIAFYEAWTRA